MSIVYTADVECDAPDCMEWVHGVVQGYPNKLRSNARKVAKKKGWVRIQCAYGKMEDRCPDHAHGISLISVASNDESTK